LRYCKRCGESLGQTANELEQQANMRGATIKRVKQGEHGWDIEEIEPPGISVKKLASMFWAVAVFGFVSFAVMFGCAIPMIIFEADKSIFISMFMFGSGAIVVIAWLLIQQLSRLIGMAERETSTSRRIEPERPAQNVAPQNVAPQIVAPPRSVGSVTEHTTRNFDQIYKEPGTRA
jgi:hypothetical protein